MVSIKKFLDNFDLTLKRSLKIKSIFSSHVSLQIMNLLSEIFSNLFYFKRYSERKREKERNSATSLKMKHPVYTKCPKKIRIPDLFGKMFLKKCFRQKFF